jgi:hypothetical protein
MSRQGALTAMSLLIKSMRAPHLKKWILLEDMDG